MPDVPDSHRHCPVGHATALLGDRWSMLIVREALAGADRYQQFREALSISDHTLTRRLAHLQSIGVLERAGGTDDAAPGTGSTRYRLTEAGQDLARVLAVLGDWGLRWLPVDRPLRQPSAPVVDARDRLGIDPHAR